MLFAISTSWQAWFNLMFTLAIVSTILIMVFFSFSNINWSGIIKVHTKWLEIIIYIIFSLACSTLIYIYFATIISFFSYWTAGTSYFISFLNILILVFISIITFISLKEVHWEKLLYYDTKWAKTSIYVFISLSISILIFWSYAFVLKEIQLTLNLFLT